MPVNLPVSHQYHSKQWLFSLITQCRISSLCPFLFLHTLLLTKRACRSLRFIALWIYSSLLLDSGGICELLPCCLSHLQCMNANIWFFWEVSAQLCAFCSSIVWRQFNLQAHIHSQDWNDTHTDYQYIFWSFTSGRNKLTLPRLSAMLLVTITSLHWLLPRLWTCVWTDGALVITWRSRRRTHYGDPNDSQGTREKVFIPLELYLHFSHFVTLQPQT